MSRCNLAYLAGFFDGEGSIYLSRGRDLKHGPQFFLCASVVNTKPKSVEDFAVEFGGHVTTNPKTDRHQLQYRHRIYSSEAADMLSQLHPYLRLKKRQAELGMAFQCEISQWFSSPRVLMPATRKLWYAEQIGVLNARGELVV